MKILHEQYNEDDDFVERFKREARSVAQLQHPNIVTVIDRGEEDGRQYIVFEYIDGENLKEFVVRKGRLEVREALEIAVEIARALAFAHEHGLVHRDVKPQNVLLNGDGRAKVTDFGIARSLDVERGVTQTGTVLGTSNYIAPEQASGQPVDAHTDVYSLGVVLYELLTGDVPFPGESFVAVAMKHVQEPPPNVLDVRGDVPLRVAASDRPGAREGSGAALSDHGCIRGRARGLSRRARPRSRTATSRWSSRPRKRLAPPKRRKAGLASADLHRVAQRARNRSRRRRLADGRRQGQRDPRRRADPDRRRRRVRPRTATAPSTTPPRSTPRTATLRPTGRPRPTTTGSNGQEAASGCVLDADAATSRCRASRSSTDTPGFTAEIRATNIQGTLGGSSSRTGASSRGRRGSRSTSLRRSAYYLIWITKLAPDGHFAHVNEVRAFGKA